MLNTLKLEQIDPTLINLTGIRILVIFSLLLNSPKTAEEINEYFKQNNYPKELFSVDTLRNDINALKCAGCNITRADKTNHFKYKMISHPLELDIDEETAECLNRFYKKIYNCLSISQLVDMENLFNTIAEYTKNEKVSEYIKGISLLKNIDKNNIKTLLQAEKNRHTISFKYKSPNSGILSYKFKLCYMNFRSEKLYINGYNITYNNIFSFLPVNNIIYPITINLEDTAISPNEIKVIYELKNEAMKNFINKSDERIIAIYPDKIVVEHIAYEFFKLNQKILEYGPNCTVIYPESVKNYTINTLKQMYEVYKNDEL